MLSPSSLENWRARVAQGAAATRAGAEVVDLEEGAGSLGSGSDEESASGDRGRGEGAVLDESEEVEVVVDHSDSDSPGARRASGWPLETINVAMNLGIAPSGRATCVACRGLMAKGVARVYAEEAEGAPVRHGGNGRRHVRCARPLIEAARDAVAARSGRGADRPPTVAVRLLIDEMWSRASHTWTGVLPAERRAIAAALFEMRAMRDGQEPEGAAAAPPMRLADARHTARCHCAVELCVRSGDGLNSSRRYGHGHGSDVEEMLLGLDDSDFTTLRDPPEALDAAAVSPSRLPPHRMLVADLRAELTRMELDASGLKAALVSRLEAARAL